MSVRNRVATLCLATAIGGLAADAVNRDSAIIEDFQRRVAKYVQLRNKVESKLPRLHTTSSPEKIAQHRHQLQDAIRLARSGATQGEIFTTPIQTEFRRLMKLAMQQADGKRVEKSMGSAEPVNIRPSVNYPYPDPGRIPLQSTPPTILLNLPHLPKEMEYRFTSGTLILLDSRANMVIDFISNVSP